MTDRWLKVANKSVAAVAEKVTETAVTVLLTGTPLAAVSVFAAPAFASAIKELVEQFSEETSALDQKLNILLDEPFATARQTIDDVLSATFETTAELREADRQIATAFDKLRKAYNYAKTPDERGMVFLYLALVSALKKGGGGFTREYTRKIRKSYRQAVEAAQSKADSYNRPILWNRDIGAAGSFHPAGIGGLPTEARPTNMQAIAGLTKGPEEYQKRLYAEAAAMAETAERVEGFCQFVEFVSKNRDKIFMTTRAHT